MYIRNKKIPGMSVPGIFLTYNKIDVIITLASKIVWRHAVGRDMFPHISFKNFFE